MSSSYKLRLRRTVLNWRWILISPGLVIGNAYMWSIKRITP